MKRKVINLLIIDDDDLDLWLGTKIVGQSKLIDDVVAFESGLKAIEYLQNLQDEWPQIILCDINMPAMNGFQLVDQLLSKFNENLNHSMICMLSSSRDSVDLLNIEKRPEISMGVVKPLSIDKLDGVLNYYNSVFIN